MAHKLRPPARSLSEPMYPDHVAQLLDSAPAKAKRQTRVERRYRIQTRIVWQHFKGLHWHSVAACLVCQADATKFVVWWRGLTKPLDAARWFR